MSSDCSRLQLRKCAQSAQPADRSRPLNVAQMYKKYAKPDANVVERDKIAIDVILTYKLIEF